MKVGTTVSSPWRYLAEARVDRKGVEESWEEMVSWLSWLFELVYLKRASSASTLTWCCSRRWHISILFILTHTHTHTHSHTYSHTQTHVHALRARLPPTSPLRLTQHPWSWASRALSCQIDRVWGGWHVTPWDRIKCVIASLNKEARKWETVVNQKVLTIITLV